MGKKNLIILLMIPFIIALLSIVTANITINVIDKDILGIKWNYNEIETTQEQQTEDTIIKFFCLFKSTFCSILTPLQAINP